MKTIISFFFLTIISASAIAQSSDWTCAGQTTKYDVYYLKKSVVRGTYTYVSVLGKFRNKETDSDGKEYKYATGRLAYYNSAWNDLRCILMDVRYYYTDNDYRKSNEDKKQYIVSNTKILNDIWDKIK